MTQNTVTPIDSIPLEDIRAAQARISGSVVRTPLLRLNVDDAPADIHLKLENMQPNGSFKLRGAMNALKLAGDTLRDGVWTVSSGNMAIAMAWASRELGIDCSVVVSDDTPANKLAAIEKQGAGAVKVPWSKVLEIASTHEHEGMNGAFIHPFAHPDVLAGNGTIGLEILEDLPDVEAVVVPYGGGGLTTSIGSAIKAVDPNVKLYAAEVETGAPVAPSLAAGRPVEVENTPSFVSGIGTPFVFPEMWPLASSLLDGSLIATLSEIAAAIKLIAERNHVISEAAGATPVAAALSGGAGSGKVACVVSGGNIDPDKLIKILQGGVP